MRLSHFILLLCTLHFALGNANQIDTKKLEQTISSCIDKNNIKSCKDLINDKSYNLPSIDKCDPLYECGAMGNIHDNAGIIKEAMQYYKKACNADSFGNCHNLALLLDVAKKYKDANAMYEKACNGKIAISCLNLGVSYANGSGIAKDKKRAKDMFQKACKLGETKACEYEKILKMD